MSETKTTDGKVTITHEPIETKKDEMLKVTSDTSIDFPSLGWGITAGEIRELPEDEEARKTILANTHIKNLK